MSFLGRLKASYLRAFLCIGLSVMSMMLLNPSTSSTASKQSNCAIQALYAAAHHFGMEASGMASTSHASTMLDIVKAAKDIGLEVTGIQFSNEDLKVLPQPFIAHFSEGHFVFVKSIHEGQVQIVDNGREAVMDINQFMQRSSGNAVLFKQVKG